MSRQEIAAQGRVFAQIYSLQLRRLVAYRTDFWFGFASNLLANVVLAYFLWTAIFSGRDTSIEGYTLFGMMYYYTLVPLVENITRSSVGMGGMSSEIYEGTLTRYLVYPTPFFLYRVTHTAAAATVAVVQMGIVIGGFVLFSPSGNELGLSPWSVTLGLVAAFCAMLLNLLMASIVEMVAFWAENVWTLGVMLMFAVRLLGGALLPLALFPEPWQRALAYSPFPYMISFPILSITGKVTGLEWLKGMGIIGAWVLALSWVYALVWQRGNLRYSGAGQ